ncbi:hypothetical protein [Streptomyces erythrochromogenes]|uniref:hypothetical protein n=1 Tax=Streptomyces erythrochromogenes TaxID=285574 RepID=UPI00224E41B6|nr:hypothetical protein [Streptomyces erythrochromogenes]MCX5584241.1 hypothetical protein [Streptomyces erythrochromogenes]
MTDHRAEAIRLLELADNNEHAATLVQAAQVHALLRAGDLQQQMLGTFDVAAQHDAAAALARTVQQRLDEVLRIVTDYVIESNDVGGIDCNDLADRLRTAGYPLVGDDDHDAPAA